MGHAIFVGGCAKTHLTEVQQMDQDQKAITQLQEDLIQLPETQAVLFHNPKELEKEASLIAKALVDQTRETNREFQMTGGPKWHNFLIKLGIREKGYCYQWVPELLKTLPAYPLKFFERHWGGSFLSMGRENNAVIITKRGAPLHTGVVYDAWRGVGRPFWKSVSEDKKYRWTQRFNEEEILSGEAKVEPK